MDSRTKSNSFSSDSTNPSTIQSSVFIIKMIKAISLTERTRYMKAKAEKAARIRKRNNLKVGKGKEKLKEITYGMSNPEHTARDSL